jgi:ATPase subunit of ABC transporter with duplicated ATPase domains
LRFITQKDVEQLKTSTYSTSLTNGSGSKPETTALLGSKDDEPGVLTIEDLLVKRSNVSASFSIHSGERVGVSGRSGVGKSQLLRTISGLEEPGDTDGIVSLSNMSLGTTESPVWRRHVVWVSQDRPTIGGTPNDFYEEVKRYHSHRAETEDSSSTSSPTEIAAEWGLAPAIMDRPWSSLSGGEAQRASLAIALALKPKALLADEPTSACDEATVRKMEATLASHNVPMLIVTHSKEQLERFCTHHLELK